MRRFLPALTLVLALAALAPAVAPAKASSATAPPTFSGVRHLSANGASLGYRVGGRGRPLVLIPGFILTMAEWDPAFIGALATHRRVYIFDNRGVATSTGSVRNLTISKMAGDTAVLIQKLGLRRADVLGFSMGGYIAQELVLRHPRRVDRLVLAATDPGGQRTVQPSAAVLRILDDPDTTQAQLLSVLFPPDQQAAGGAWYQRMGQAFVADHLPADSFTVSPATLAAQIRAGSLWAGRHGGTYKRLRHIKRPTLVADGRDDVVVPPANSRTLARKIPRARLVLYRDAGHAFLFQPETRFSARVARFLSR